MTDAARTPITGTPPAEVANAASRRPPAQYDGLLDPTSCDQLSTIISKYPTGLILREIASVLEKQAGEYLEKDLNFGDPVESQNAYLKSAQSRSLRSIATTF